MNRPRANGENSPLRPKYSAGAPRHPDSGARSPLRVTNRRRPTYRAGARKIRRACCAFYRGEKVVDIWGGARNKDTGKPWERDTMVVIHSATKGLAAMTLAIAHSRGWLDYDERVAAYWPEFAQNGKQDITVRQLLAHQGGGAVLPRLHEALRELALRWTTVVRLARDGRRAWFC